MRVLVTSCDKSIWTIRPFAYLFNKYWSELQSVTVLTESIPSFSLPPNFTIKQANIDGNIRWPMQQWSNGLIRFLEGIPEQQVVIFLDDYWFVRQVDYSGINTLAEYMRLHPKILRIDLTTDRVYAGGAPRPMDGKDYDTYGHYDLFEVPGSPYQMSLMPGIWNKEKLLTVLKPNWTPWEVELTGTDVLNNQFPEFVVLGTRQNPVRFTNALRNEKKEIDVRGMKPDDLQEIRKWFPPNEDKSNA